MVLWPSRPTGLAVAGDDSYPLGEFQGHLRWVTGRLMPTDDAAQAGDAGVDR